MAIWPASGESASSFPLAQRPDGAAPQDNSDRQYRAFRNGLLPLVLLASTFLALKQLYIFLARFARPASSSRTSTNNLSLVPFTAGFAVLMLFGLHGASAFKVLAILSANYALVRAAGGHRVAPLLAWVFNAAVLFANERNGGYRFAALHPVLASLVNVISSFFSCLRA